METSLCCSEVIGLKEESSSVQSLKEEFTQHIADTERKAQLACKERDIAKKVKHKHISMSVSGITVPGYSTPIRIDLRSLSQITEN